MSAPILTVAGLVAGYGRIRVLHGIDFDAHDREIVALIGPNGAGKTTFLETLAGTVHPWKGCIHLQGKRVDGRSVLDRRKMGMMLVPQEAYVFPYMSVRANLEVGGRFNRQEKHAELLRYVYDLFPILRERSGQMASTLSGGQQKMLAVGMGIMGDARVMLLDEPSIGLAPQLVTRLFGLLKRLRDETDKTLVLAEQNIKVLEIADQIFGLEAGQIRFKKQSESLDEEGIKELFLGK